MEKNQLTIQKEAIQGKLRSMYELSKEIINDINTLKRSLHVEEKIVDNIKTQVIMCIATVPDVSKPEHKEFINYYLNKYFIFDEIYKISSSLPGTIGEDKDFCEVDLILSDNVQAKFCD